MNSDTKLFITVTTIALGGCASILALEFQSTINAHMYNRALLKEKKLRMKHEENMARIKNTQEEK